MYIGRGAVTVKGGCRNFRAVSRFRDRSAARPGLSGVLPVSALSLRFLVLSWRFKRNEEGAPWGIPIDGGPRFAGGRQGESPATRQGPRVCAGAFAPVGFQFAVVLGCDLASRLRRAGVAQDHAQLASMILGKAGGRAGRARAGVLQGRFGPFFAGRSGLRRYLWGIRVAARTN